MARHMALACAAAGRRALYVSREMPKEQVTRALLTALSGIDGRRWRRPGDVKKREMTWAVQWLLDHPITILDALTTPGDIAAEARRMRAEAAGLDLVLADFLQALRPSREARGGTREQAVSEMMAELAAIALPGGAHVPIVILSAIRRPEGQGAPEAPTERDLRESGMIESWATLIGLLHRPTYYQTDLEDKSGPCHVILPKSRFGPTGEVTIHFDAPTASFRESAGGL